MSVNDELNRDADIDLGGIFSSIWRNKIKLLMLSLIVTLLAFAVLQVVEPRYRSEARVLIDPQVAPIQTPGTPQPSSPSDVDDAGIASQVQLIQSRSVAAKVIEKLGLMDKAEFDSARSPTFLNSVLSMLDLHDEPGSVRVQDRVLEAFYERLAVFQAERSRVIVVQFWSHDAKLAAQVPNAITDEYLALLETQKRGAGAEDLQKLEPELKALQNSVLKAEAAVADFRASSDLLLGTDNNTLATQELSELSTELGRIRSQRSRAEADASAVGRAIQGGSIDSVARVLQSPLIQRLQERKVSLNGQLAELSTTLMPRHPQIQSLQQRIRALDNQIGEEGRKIQVSLQKEAEVAKDREQNLMERRNQLKAEAARVDKSMVQLRSLEREAEAQRQRLSSYLVQFKEAQSRQQRAFLPNDAFVFSRANEKSKPFFPKKVPILAGTFFGTFLLGSMFVLAASVLSGGDRSTASARARYDERPVGLRTEPVVASARGESDLYAPERSSDLPIADPRDDMRRKDLQDQTDAPATPAEPGLFSKAVRSASSLAELKARGEDTVSIDDGPSTRATSAATTAKSLKMLGKARIAMISPEGDTGSECTAIFSRYLAGYGCNVIVLDMSGSGSSSRIMLGEGLRPGVRDLLAETAGFSDTIHADRASSAHIMPAGRDDARLAPGSAARLPTIIEALQQTYDYLVVDCGAVDVAGLRRVVDERTVTIITKVKASNEDIARVSADLIRSGLRTPLVVQATEEERDLLDVAIA